MVSQINNSQGIRYLTVCILILAVITDILDGILARRYNEVTELGKIIDPLADKIVLAVVIYQLYIIGELPAYYLIIIVGRDLLILLGGILVSQKIGRVLPSNILGKIAVLSIGIFILAVVLELKSSITFLYNIFFYLSLILVFISFIIYLIRAAKSFLRNQDGSI
jgi:CDP-diacylglycerol--glycerol-3-phosphate 3-phosphatidyltransferase